LTTLRLKKVLLEGVALRRTLNRLAMEIVERNDSLDNLVLIGIYTGGAHLAKRIQRYIKRIEGVTLPLGTIDITLYRDDVFRGLEVPMIGYTKFDFTIDGKKVVLVDDVLYTGRTIRAALDLLVDLGRPKSVQLAVLADRGHRELPIQPDYCGMKIETADNESVKLEVKEEDFEVDRICLREKVKPRAKAAAKEPAKKTKAKTTKKSSAKPKKAAAKPKAATKATAKKTTTKTATAKPAKKAAAKPKAAAKNTKKTTKTSKTGKSTSTTTRKRKGN